MEKVTRDDEAGMLALLYPVMVSVAGDPVEADWIRSQVAASGVQVQEAACCGVSFGGSLVSLTQSGSIAPRCILSPPETICMAGAPAPKVMSIFQEAATPSRQRKLGGVISGGKMEPSSG